MDEVFAKYGVHQIKQQTNFAITAAQFVLHDRIRLSANENSFSCLLQLAWPDARLLAQHFPENRRHEYTIGEIKHWLLVFAYRFFRPVNSNTVVFLTHPRWVLGVHSRRVWISVATYMKCQQTLVKTDAFLRKSFLALKCLSIGAVGRRHGHAPERGHAAPVSNTVSLSCLPFIVIRFLDLCFLTRLYP